jgi:hypothetical protein
MQSAGDSHTPEPLRAPMSECAQGPRGSVMVRIPVRVAGAGCVVTLTAFEIHLAFVDCEGPNFSISFPALALAMAQAAEATIWGLRNE